MTTLLPSLRAFAVLLLALTTLPGFAGSPAILEYSARLPAETAYQRVYEALEDKGYFVIFEPDMGRTLAGMAEKLGDDYNRNKLSTMRSLVFCNPRATQRIANADPALLALCPLHVSLVHRDGVSTVYFARPSAIAAGSPGEAITRQLEHELDALLRNALDER